MHVIATTRWRRVAEIAAAQHGCITLAQLRGAGCGRGAVDHAVLTGRLHRVHTRVLAVGHAGLTPAGRRMAAVLCCGEGAVLSHRPAAVTHGLRRGDTWPVDVTSPTGRGRGVAGIRARRSPLATEDISAVDGIPVTSVARTLADLGHEAGERDLRRMIREAQFLGVFDVGATVRANDRRPSARLSRVLDDLVPTESPLEDLFRERILEPFAIPEPVYQQRLPGARPDFRWPRARLIVELDGGHHANALTHQADIARDNVLHLAGELVLRYAKPDLTRHARRTAGQIIRALNERGGYDIPFM